MDDNQPYGEFSDNDFKKLSDFIYINYGINLYPNKRVLVKSRLQSRLKETGIRSYTEYCDFVLNKDPDRMEAVEMINRLSTNKTDFFREDNHFNYLTQTLLPSYLSGKENNTIKVWSAGCSSGEEPFTIAMVLNEQKNIIPLFDYSIYASDISTSVLKTASTAIYPGSAVIQIPVEYRAKYLLRSRDKIKNQIRISPILRKKIEFFRYNLLNPKSPIVGTVDIIFCRNTLIYFDRPTQERVVAKLLNCISPKGYLFLGHSESLINMNFPLEHVAASVYRKL